MTKCNRCGKRTLVLYGKTGFCSKRCYHAAYMVKYYARNREKILSQRNAHPERTQAKNARYYAKHPRRAAKLHSDWKKAHRKEINSYLNKRYAEDPVYRMGILLRNRLRGALLAARASKYSSSVELIGCTPLKLRKHVESLFKPEMSWKNYGKWVLDHKIACCRFDLTNPDHLRVCFHYTNLQPLWRKDNLIKSAIDKCKPKWSG